ncbi:MAG: HAMP domain-containing histidine kinase [Firmicutes bacterium]|nr:HAMP domain-containing histidine kinase [Bacillota bacterium]
MFILGKLSTRVMYFFSTLFVAVLALVFLFLRGQSGGTLIVLLVVLPLCALAIVTTYVFAVYEHKNLEKCRKEIMSVSKRILAGDYKERITHAVIDKDLDEIIFAFNSLAANFEDMEQVRKEFISNASHELRSPLTSIQGFIQGMLDGIIPPTETKKYLHIVFAETKRLNSIIASMLELSRMESGKYPLKKEVFDINELIRRVLVRFEPHILRKEMSIQADFVIETCQVKADKERIEQVLVNLVDNAIKYSPAFTKINVATHLHANKVYISVQDAGIGISKKDQLLIWDRFFTADKARTPGKSKGTGLGLSIVKRIIDEHNEVIWVESNKSEGSTFIFTLSLAAEAETSSQPKGKYSL